MKGLYFAIFILALQQLDGNYIGPKILGGSTGLTSFWVIFAIMIGGGLYGFAGMLLGAEDVTVTINGKEYKNGDAFLKKAELQESDIVVEDQTKVIDLQTAHSHTLQTHAKSKTRILLRINTAIGQYLGVNHTGT